MQLSIVLPNPAGELPEWMIGMDGEMTNRVRGGGL